MFFFPGVQIRNLFSQRKSLFEILPDTKMRSSFWATDINTVHSTSKGNRDGARKSKLNPGLRRASLYPGY
jgi:hypothetical protein